MYALITGLQKLPHCDLQHFKIRPSVQKLASWPKKLQGTRLLSKNLSYYVLTCRKVKLDSWKYAQSTGLQKLPHFDLLHFKIRPLVQKLVPWPKKLQGTRLLDKNSQSGSMPNQQGFKNYPILTYKTSKSDHWFKS